MKTSILKIGLSGLIVIFCHLSHSQDFQGKAYYQTKTTVDMERFGAGREMIPDQKKRMEERMKSWLEKTYVLTFNKSESIYKEDDRLEAPGMGGGFGGFGSSFTGGPKYKNVKTKELLQDQEFFGKQFLIKDKLKAIEWTIGKETKQIGNYLCFKATATKPVEGFSFGNFRRPNETEKDSIANNQNEELRTVEVVAWYTMQIPVNQGPDDYWGLPGLILEVSADRTTILCTKIVMNPEKKETVKKPEKGKVVTQKEYNEIITKKMEEMRNNRGRNGGGLGRRGF